MIVFCDFCDNDGKVHFSRARRRFICVVFILTLISVPSTVVCLPDWSDYIEYKTFLSPPKNYTYTPTIVNEYYQSPSDSSEIADDYESDNRENKLLLVGFSHDPYRASVTEAEYYDSIRSTNSTSKSESRGKRGVSHLYNMIHCATGCEPLNYKGYGCYCGFQGSGRYTDGIDRCCKMHDQCYENIYCPVYTVYLQPYYWQCINHEPYCALENRFSGNRGINACAGRLCECDRRLAMCLRRYGCPRRRALCKSSPLRLLQNLLLP